MSAPQPTPLLSVIGASNVLSKLGCSVIARYTQYTVQSFSAVANTSDFGASLTTTTMNAAINAVVAALDALTDDSFDATPISIAWNDWGAGFPNNYLPFGLGAGTGDPPCDVQEITYAKNLSTGLYAWQNSSATGETFFGDTGIGVYHRTIGGSSAYGWFNGLITSSDGAHGQVIGFRLRAWGMDTLATSTIHGKVNGAGNVTEPSTVDRVTNYVLPKFDKKFYLPSNSETYAGFKAQLPVSIVANDLCWSGQCVFLVPPYIDGTP